MYTYTRFQHNPVTSSRTTTTTTTSSDFEEDPNYLDIDSDSESPQIAAATTTKQGVLYIEPYPISGSDSAYKKLTQTTIDCHLSKTPVPKCKTSSNKVTVPTIAPRGRDVSCQTRFSVVDVATQTGQFASVTPCSEVLEQIIDDKVYTRCPECFQFNSYLSRHLRVIHNYTASQAAYFRANFKKSNSRAGHTGKSITHCCPVQGCVAKIVNVKRHLTGYHKMSEERQAKLYGYASRSVNLFYSF